MAIHYSILAWKIPWTEEPGRLQSVASQSRTRLSTHTHAHTLLIYSVGLVSGVQQSDSVVYTSVLFLFLF